MTYRPRAWARLQAADGTPVYVRPPDGEWFVPDAAGDRLLRSLQRGRDAPPTARELRFLARLPPGEGPAPRGREQALSLERLAEVWLHVTDRCNMSCRHCLFGCSAEAHAELSLDRALSLARQAAGLGCRIFALTGGEPLVHPQIAPLIEGLLALDGAHVVVLTNGLLVADLIGALPRWPRQRLHLQLSIDGLAATNDRIRGAGSFARVTRLLATLRDGSYSCTLSMAVGAHNAAEMAGVVELAAAHQLRNVHFMWHFVRGRGLGLAPASPEQLFGELTRAAERGEQLGVSVDNIDALRAQVFAPSGTVHDGSNAGWESLAVGADGALYPTPAMVGLEQMATPIDGDLERAWRESPALARLRALSVAGDDEPLRFLTGGGDPDHRLMHGGALDAADPHDALYQRLVLWSIARAAAPAPPGDGPALRLKRGEVLASCGAQGAVALTHSNCLLSVAGTDSRTPVRELYSRAAEVADEEILNPVSYPEALVSHIPAEARLRCYGCGSPVLDARLAAGETLVDLGSGTGVECLIAAPLVGPSGRVVGVDMLEPMLRRARRGAAAVAETLGYANVAFREGYLEQLPLDDRSADAMISNCVINLSVDKRRTFGEIRRVLRPGGRLVVADVVCEDEPPAAVRADERLKGECIAGALTQRDLFGLLRESGFSGLRVLRRFPYREVQGHPFFSLTFEARRPALAPPTERVIYRGPFEAVLARGGELLYAGQLAELPADEVDDLAQSVLVLGQRGEVQNLDLGDTACCCVPPGAGEETCCAPAAPAPSIEAAASGCGCPPEGAAARRDRASEEAAPSCHCSPEAPTRPTRPAASEMSSGCIVCGAELRYLAAPRQLRCAYCGQTVTAQASCAAGHFVCDACHAGDALAVLEHLCASSAEPDMIAMLAQVRAHPAIHVHGPEHHALVPAIIVASYGNLGGVLPEGALATAIARGAKVPGGFCGFAGTCGAAVGVGIGLSVILGANPRRAEKRQQALQAGAAALAAVAGYQAARCCQRDCWLALRSAAESSRALLPLSLRAEAPLRCEQTARNKECLRQDCPLYPGR